MRNNISVPGNNVRFHISRRILSCLLVFFTILFSILVLQAFNFQMIILPLTAFLFEWYVVHGASLSRVWRACFDESNVLETYQPRARTMGHLFMPDPPTPSPGSERSKEDIDKFNAMRDQHYANEYTNIAKLEAERALLSKDDKSNSAVNSILNGGGKVESMKIEMHFPEDDDLDTDEI